MEQLTPSCLWDKKNDLLSLCKEKKPFLFFDYDGTLTPIAKRPELALLDPDRKEFLTSLAEKFPMAVVSGRSLADLKEKISIPHIFYVGSHGMEIEMPSGKRFDPPYQKEALEELKKCVVELTHQIRSLPGIALEDKPYCFAIHYRLADKNIEEKTLAIVLEAKKRYPLLSAGFGKKIVELKTSSSWHKGSSVLWIMSRFLKENFIPFYFGDDTTDEDAFLTLKNSGITVCVMDGKKQTEAKYYLKDVEDVYAFLALLFQLKTPK